MLRIPAPFPEVGSYALLIDTNLPAVQQRAELVRVMRRDPAHGQSAVAFPLRVGAFGNRVVGESELIDATPLTKDEERELADLQRHLAGRDRLRGKLVAAAVRCEKTDVELRGGQHFLLKGDTGAFGTIFFGTADSGELEA
jgi:hypothetical protein